MTSWILMSRSSSVAADTASFRVKTKEIVEGKINRRTCECINIKLIHLSSPVSRRCSEHRGDISLKHPSSPAAIVTSKHLLHLWGRLCCAWRWFLFQVTHTHTHRAVCCICNDRVCQAQCYDFRGVCDS